MKNFTGLTRKQVENLINNERDTLSSAELNELFDLLFELSENDSDDFEWA